MCFMCPDCNVDETDYNKEEGGMRPCSDYFGCNSKLMGGYAGLAAAMSFAIEYQGEATPHAHGFESLANMYQHHTLEEIGNRIERNAEGIAPESMLERITRFSEHLRREDHLDHEQHARSLDFLEKQFHANNEGPPENIFLSVRPTLPTTTSAPSLWHRDGMTDILQRKVSVREPRFVVYVKQTNSAREGYPSVIGVAPGVER